MPLVSSSPTCFFEAARDEGVSSHTKYTSIRSRRRVEEWFRFEQPLTYTDGSSDADRLFGPGAPPRDPCLESLAHHAIPSDNCVYNHNTTDGTRCAVATARCPPSRYGHALRLCASSASAFGVGLLRTGSCPPLPSPSPPVVDACGFCPSMHLPITQKPPARAGSLH